MTAVVVLLSSGMMTSLAGDQPRKSSQAGDESTIAAEAYPMRGVVVAKRQVTLAAPLDGVLRQLNVVEGDTVTTGEVLAALDDRVARAQYDVSALESMRKGPLKKAEANLEQARINLEQVKSMRTRDGAPKRELQVAENEVERASAELTTEREEIAIAIARLQVNLMRIEQHQITAPFDGVVTRINVEAGIALNQSMPILTVLSLEELKIDVHVPLEYFDKLKIGESYRFDAEEPVHAEVHGVLTHIDPAVNAATRSFRCVFAIANPERSMPSGFTASLKLDNFDSLADAEQ
jgi:RND family efflux transporter MFP subunit